MVALVLVWRDRRRGRDDGRQHDGVAHGADGVHCTGGCGTARPAATGVVAHGLVADAATGARGRATLLRIPAVLLQSGYLHAVLQPYSAGGSNFTVVASDV